MQKRGIAWKRHHAKRVQEKRLKKIKAISWFGLGVGKKHYGMLRKYHFGCGCFLCKPWKWKIESKYKISELRKLQKEGV